MKKTWFILLALFIIITRLYIFGFEKSVWLDEAVLARNIIEKNFLELFLPLSYAQSAPPMFLALTKVLTSVCGYSEKVLRFIPFICGTLSVFAFCYLLNLLYLNKTKETKLALFFTLFSTFVFSMNFRLLYNTIEFKPYTSDILFTILVFIIYLKFIIKKDPEEEFLSPKSQITLGLVYALFPLFSFGSIFAICAVCLILLFKKKWTLPLMFFAALSCYYFLFLKQITTGTTLYDYWTQMFINYSPVRFIEYFIFNLSYIFTLRSAFLYFAVILFITGTVLSLLPSKDTRAEEFAPIVLTVFGAYLASAINVYPLYERLALFLFPVLFILILYPVYYAIESDTAKYKKLCAVCAATALLLSTFSFEFLTPASLYEWREQIKPALEKLGEMKKEDKIVVFNNTKHVFYYYQNLFKFENETYICPNGEDFSSIKEIEKFCANSTCWIITSSEMNKQQDKYILAQYAAKHGGRLILEKGPFTALYKITP